MTNRRNFQLTMMEQVGAPLLGALARSAGGGPPSAAITAQLLNRAVQLGIGFAQGMDLRGPDADATSARLALTALAAGLVADRFTAGGRVPDDAELRTLLPSAQALLVFADLFAPVQPDEAPLSPEAGAAISYMKALAPAIAAIAAFSFGRQERKLAQDVAERLTARSTAMLRAVAGDAATPAAALGLLDILAGIYADCHRAEAARLQNLDDQARTALVDGSGLVTLDALWAAFEAQAAMLEALGQGFGADAGRAAATPMPATPPAPPPVAAKTETARPANPMGFFKPGAKPAPVENGDGV